VDFYKEQEQAGKPNAPKYTRISGVGSIDEISQQLEAALSK